MKRKFTDLGGGSKKGVHLYTYFVVFALCVPVFLIVVLATGGKGFLTKHSILTQADEKNVSDVGSQMKPIVENTRVQPSASDTNQRKATPNKVTKNRIMYLTFDDGPSPNTIKILDILKKHQIKATFFVVGQSVERYPEIAKRIVKEGHAIGIHCNEHVYGKLYKSQYSYYKDFKKAHQIVYKVTGVNAKIYRFPGGSKNSFNKRVYKKIIQMMKKKGYVYFDWNASLEDSNGPATVKGIIKEAVHSAGNKKRVIMLAHDAGASRKTVQALESIIKRFSRYSFHKITESTKAITF